MNKKQARFSKNLYRVEVIFVLIYPTNLRAIEQVQVSDSHNSY